MRINHLIGHLGTGGAESLVYNLAIEQVQTGHKVKIWTLSAPSAGHLELLKQRTVNLADCGVDVEQVATGARQVPKAAWNFWRALNSCVSVDSIIHSHSPVAALVAGTGGRGLPNVMTIHGTTVNFPAPVWRLVSSRTAAFAVVNSGSRPEIDRHIRKPIHLVENGIPITAAPKRRSPADGANMRECQIIAVGGLRREKNYPRLLEAMSRVIPAFRSEGIETYLKVAGDGVALKELATLSKDLGIASNVDFLGVRSDIDQLLPKADLFVSSSDHEGLPIALLEAMAAGVPCVSTPFSSALEVLDGGLSGRIATSFSAIDLAEAIVDVLRSPDDRHKLSRSGRQRVMDYSIARCALAYEEVYGSVLQT